MGPHLHDDYKEIDFRAMIGSDDDGEHPVSPQTRRNVEAFLGSGHIVDIPLSAPRYYCDLAAWALERQREEKGWDAEQVIGHRVRQARYTRVSVAPGQAEVLLQAGILFLKRGGVPLVVYVDLDPSDKADVVVVTSEEHRDHAVDFARALDERIAARQLYRGHNLEFSGTMTFLELAPRTWDDIALPDSTRDAIIAHTTRFLSRAPTLEPHGISPRRGLLLTGKPGTGKTLVCKALMNTSPGITCIVAHTGSLMHPVFVDELYKVAADLSPSIVFLEDIDLVGQGRIRSHYSSADALSRLLFALDGVQDCRNVVTVATTNWLEILDEALADRPSRFDRVISIDPPDAAQRRNYLTYLARQLPLPPDILEHLVESTAGLTPAQIQEVVHSAAIESPVPPDSPDYWSTVFSASAVQLALRHVRRSNGGKVGFEQRRTA